MVRAKFTAYEVNTSTGVIKLTPVVSGSEENKQFFSWTPFGNIEMGTINPEAIKQFEVGKEYYVDFTKVE